MTEQLDGLTVMRQFLPTSPYVTHLGIELVEATPDQATLRLPFREQVITIGRTVHGGAIASLIDTAAMVAAWVGGQVPENLRGTTVSLTVTYLAPGDDVDLTATARALRRGRSLTTVEVDVTRPDGESVARGLVTYKLG